MWQVDNVTARQIKAARALLDWSQEDLAENARLSVATIRKLELGYKSPRCSTAHVIRQAIEDAGLEFINAEGVRRRSEEIITYEEPEGLAAFCDDIHQTIKKKGGDIAVVTASEETLAQICGSEDYQNLESLLTLNDTTTIRCILTDPTDQPMSTPRFEFRLMSKHYVDPIPYLVYGDKFAVVIPAEDAFPKVVVMHSSGIVRASLKQFHSMWDKAACLQVQVAANRKETKFREQKRKAGTRG